MLKGLLTTLKAMFVEKPVTIQYPEEYPPLPARYRGRIILSRDPDGGEQCVACYLCAVVCPVDCVSHEACSLVKQACKGCLKPLILARSSGLSSLARSLAELGAPAQ